jgi:hypothetical protein
MMIYCENLYNFINTSSVIGWAWRNNNHFLKHFAYDELYKNKEVAHYFSIDS